MRFLADENFPRAAIEALRAKGHDVFSIRESMKGAADVEVLREAQIQSRTLLTLDKDYGHLVFVQRLPAACGVLLFRVVENTGRDLFVKAVLDAVQSREDWSNLFVVIEGPWIRINLLDLPENDLP